MGPINKINNSNRIAVGSKENIKTDKEENKLSESIKIEKIEKIDKADIGKKDISNEYLDKAVKEANRIVFGNNGKFEFKIHEKTGRMLVRLVDKDTEEVIREIPPEKILDLIANIWEMVGIIVDERG